MKADGLIGTWKLVSFEAVSEEGQILYPFGKDAVGYILYTRDGFMSASLMARNRRRFASGDILGGTTVEKAAAAETYISYCGRYHVEGDKVVHDIELSFFPNWVADKQERFFSIERNKLTVTTAPMLLSGRQQTGRVIWERVTRVEG